MRIPEGQPNRIINITILKPHNTAAFLGRIMLIIREAPIIPVVPMTPAVTPVIHAEATPVAVMVAAAAAIETFSFVHLREAFLGSP
jgi:hypothetical protein